jgi:hypothetical protein
MKQQSLFDWTPDGPRQAVRCRAPHKQAVVSERRCERCEQVFSPTRKSQKFCSQRCCAAANARRHYWKDIDVSRAKARAERQRDRHKRVDWNRRYYARTREQRTLTARAHRERNRDRYLDQHLQREYGITLHDYNRMLAEQGGGCGICGAVEARSKGHGVRLHVDHDHVTGKARGLLCGTCNRGIGQLGDDLERVKAAVRYLERATNNGVFSRPKNATTTLHRL